MYDYDSYLEVTEGQRAQRKKAEPPVRKSRYIGTLLEKAEDRKKEEAIIFDRRRVPATKPTSMGHTNAA